MTTLGTASDGKERGLIDPRCDPIPSRRCPNGSQAAVRVDDGAGRFWDNREIGTDGRALPKVEDYLPRFNGYSAGKWEGDTLVVTTVGLDDRQWVDAFGYPVSEKAVLEERYSRPT